MGLSSCLYVRYCSCKFMLFNYVYIVNLNTSSNHRLESAGLNALEQLFFKYWIGNREDGNTCLVLKA